MRATGLRAGGLAGRSAAESGLYPSLPTPSALGFRVHRSPVDVCGGIGTLPRTVAFPDLASPDLSLEELSLSQTFWAQTHPHPHLKNVSRAKKEGGRWKRLSLAAFHATSSPMRPPVRLAKLWRLELGLPLPARHVPWGSTWIPPGFLQAERRNTCTLEGESLSSLALFSLCSVAP